MIGEESRLHVFSGILNNKEVRSLTKRHLMRWATMVQVCTLSTWKGIKQKPTLIYTQ